jgi:adenine phosphoribosyltransferase
MKSEYFKKYISFETKGKSDISPLLANPEAFNNMIKDLIKPFKDFDKIAAIDALGFILGGAVAFKVKKPLILIRKEGKLPNLDKDIIRESFLDYTKTNKSFEITKKSITKGDKVLIVDEWIETGAQLKAAISLIESLGGKVIGISTLNADKNEQTKILFDKYNLKSLIGAGK